MATETTPILAVSGFITIGIGLILVLWGYQMAKANQYKNHKYIMIAAAAVNAAFLVQYIVRFLMRQETTFPGPTVVRNFVYLPILIIHIITAIITVVLVIVHLKRTFVHEKTSNGTPYFEKDYRSDHRSFGRITFLFWIISFIGGIIIFFFLYVLF